jgi:hypothetical protein
MAEIPSDYDALKKMIEEELKSLELPGQVRQFLLGADLETLTWVVESKDLFQFQNKVMEKYGNLPGSEYLQRYGLVDKYFRVKGGKSFRERSQQARETRGGVLGVIKPNKKLVVVENQDPKKGPSAQ